MKIYATLPDEVTRTLFEEIALLRAEVISQRSLLIELLSRTTHERRRQIKDRLYDKRIDAAFRIAPTLRQRVGLKRKGLLI